MTPTNPFIAMPLVFGVLITLIGSLRAWQIWAKPQPETTRKIMHVAMGAIAVTFPWLFTQSWPVIVLGIGSALFMIAMRLFSKLRHSVGEVITGVERKSLGEIYYPLTVAALFTISGGDKIYYTIPIMILAFADATAALIGIEYGKHKFTTADGRKSAEGSIAFFAVAFLSAHIPLLLFTDIGRAETLLIAMILGLLITLVEAASWRGLDNVFVPMGAYALLVVTMHDPVTELIWRLVATLSLVAFVMAWRRRSSLDDSALIGAALFGYAALMIGGLTWLIAPIVLFTSHALLWPGPQTGQNHTVHAVVWITSAGMFWLFVHAMTADPACLLPYNVSFAAHLAITRVSRQPYDDRHRKHEKNSGWRGRGHWASPPWYAVWATLLTLGIPLLLDSTASGALNLPDLAFLLLIGWAAVTAAAWIFYLLLPLLYHPAPKPIPIHATGATLGLIASLVTVIG